MNNRLNLIALLIGSFFFVSCTTAADSIPTSVKGILSSVDWNLSELRCSDVSDLSLFQQHTRYYLVSGSADEVWSSYKNADLSAGWRGPIGRFGALYDPYSDVLYTPGRGPVPGIRTGQIVFLDLLIEAFLHITAAFQISDIDDDLHLIEFTYLEQNISQGRQEIRIFPVQSDEKFRTIVRHRTWYRSGSNIRDRFFYTPYHTQTIDEYHFRIAMMNNLLLTAVTERMMKKRGLIPSDQPL
ncbi:MAG: hypothetical protein RQ801_04260 [Spirochaetaceae bacterium]|nr:hypothetical protein [Spirochaetaceae bacterium]MDT8297493.1 hypothetical protein [Spirochaetaceae bacterium]